ncbi:MAG: hypothetical protein KME19_10785 [Microcoleus vaginatus WJT46-NPBG5]|jgi:hypothetical protein|nr:hypothetical protein [Microcoleus vaginatus WJT46-NPBG5]
MSDFTPIQQDAILQPFFALNQNIDLLRFNFLDENAVNQLNWQNLDKDIILDRLKAYQRLLNIGFSPSDAKKRLEDADNNAGNFLSLIEIAPTPEGEVVIPSNSDSEKANAEHLHSARAIASMSQAEFVKASSLDPEKASEIHRNATQTAAGTMVLLANAMQFSSPRVGNMLGDNTAQLRDNFQSFPSYQQLFGSLDYLQCDPCQSISSPAAYFVDLMRIVDQYITQPNQGNQGFSSLSDRRPDLEQIPLTCDNTNDTVPYTQIVNEVLEKKLKNDLGVDVYEHLAQAKYPHTLPFNLYIEQTKIYLNHLNTNLADIYATINPQESDSKTWAQAYLGLTPQELDLLIIAPPPDYLTMEYLSDRYGVDVSTANMGGLTQKGTFLKQTGLSCQELNELLYQNLSAQERQDSYIIEVMRNFYISGRNLSGGTYQYINLENDEIKNLINENNERTLDCINRFLRLARKLGWSFADLEWVLASTGIKDRRDIDEAAIQEIAKIKLLQSQTKLPLDVLCSFWGYIKTIGIGDNPNRPQDLFDRIFNNPLLLQGRSKYDPSKPNSWNINESASQSSDFGKSRLLAALQLSDEQLIDIAKIFFNDGEITLDIFNLSKLFRISTILKLLRLKADEFKILLQLLNKNQTNSFPDTFDPNLLIEIIHFCKWLTTSGFTVYELDYILNENIHPSVEVFLTEDKMASFMKNIWKAAKVSEEKNHLSSYFGIDPGLFSILAQQIAPTVENLPNADYHELLLTTVNTDDNNLEWQKIVAFLKRFSRMRLLINKLNLTEAELESINNHHEYYNIQSQSFVEINTVKEIENIYNFKKQLVPLFNKAEGGIVKYFELPESKENLEKFTGWKEKQIEGIENDASQLKSVQRLLELKKCFELCTNIGCDIDFFKNMCNLLETESSLDENTAHAVIALVKAKYNDEEWQKVFGKLNGTVEERKCKVLTDFALWKLNKENPRQLSEYLLLDVEMTSCACNSQIQLGILSVQTYLQRCSMGLEAGVTQVDIPPAWWEWITNYRKWEANRKVFLYPENYIDPSLRKSASPIFKELQDELLQSEITTETVEDAYRNYFNKFAELAQLQFVDSCYYPVQTPKSPDQIDTLFIFAKTLTQPHIFYYRRCERPTNTNPFWSYWEKIDLQINSDYVAPIYAFERLFVFWVETKEITKSQNEPSTTREKITQATIKYSFLNHSQNWVAPQTLIADVDIFSESDQNVDKKFWQQVYPIIVPDSNQNSGMIATVFGGLQGISSSNFDCEVINFFNTRASKIFGQDKHLISIITSELLASNSNLLTDNPSLWKYNTSINLSQARTGLVATTVGNLVIFAGGFGADGLSSDKVDIFEYKDGSLSPVTYQLTLSQARSNLAATTVGNLVIFAGGIGADGLYSDKVDIFEYKDGSLSPVTYQLTLSQARYALAATTVGNLVIFAGGFWGEGYSDKVDIFEYKDGSLSPVTYQLTLSQARNNLAATTVGNLVIFAGGLANEGMSDKLDIFEYKDSSLSVVTHQFTLSQARNNLAATTVGNLVIFAGGLASGGFATGGLSNKVDIFECKDGSLSVVTHQFTLSQARNNLAATTVGNLVIFAGGVGGLNAIFASGYQQYPGLYQRVMSGFYPEETESMASQGYSDKVDIFEYKDGSLSAVPHQFTLSQARNTLAVITVGNLVIFAGGSASKSLFDKVDMSDKVDVFYSLNPTFSSLPSSVTSQKDTFITPIKNQPQGFVVQRRSEAFVSLLGITSNLTRLTTSTIQEFNRKLFTEGLDGLLSLESQLISELDFPLVSNNKLDFNGAYGAYFWEIFFHIPFIIASTLNANQRYNEARQWYQYIFNPTQPHNSSSSESDRFWRFLPFRGQTPDKLQDILTNEAAIQAYQENPFDPHAIARLRIGAYEKAVVMKYIDNLLNWGDALFTQDSWESITQATTLYLLAYDLLGLKPQNLGKPPTPEPKTFAEIKAGAKGKVSDFLIDLENRPEYQEFIQKFGTAVPFNALDAYFCVSDNQEFAKYWDRVEDRLLKIRHCQNIKGIERQLALFEPPIDPMLLVRQAAAGDGAISSFITDSVPNYRFFYLLERAKGMASTVIQLGSTLLNTLEKKDAEELALLRSTQESVLLQLITKTKQKQIEEAQANLDSLQKSLQAASDRSQYYQNLIAGGWNAEEHTSIDLMGQALDSQIAATAIRWASIAGYSLPNIYGLADGGAQFGEAINMGAAIADGTAGILSHSASIATAIAQFQRRKEEWGFQQKMADWDIQQIQTQIQSANLRVDLAQAELDVHNKSIEHSRQVEQFFKDKFTNKELYQWMVGRLSSLYFQTYQIALKMAYSTEKSYQYELNKDDTYLQPTYWDSYKKGLLAGESLMLGLNQLEKAYLDGSDRRLEIEKIIPLSKIAPEALANFKKNGSCHFSFKQKDFDDDFPSHYCRQIKTISVSIPAVVGPYQNINATLTQTSNKVLIKPDKSAVEWLLGLNGNSSDTGTLSLPAPGTLRQGWRNNQQIAISKGVNDSGLFVLNFQDERYLPFEGTGAISDWTLEMPKNSNDKNDKIDFDSITDVIIILNYTARSGV